MVDGRRTGTKVKNPLVQIANGYRAASKSICTQLGLGASSSGMMNLQPPKTPPAGASAEWLPAKDTP